MSVDFLTAEQKEQYGQFACEPNDVQLARYFHLDESDLGLIATRRDEHNKLGFALQLTTARFLGTFLPNIILTPEKVQFFVAQQLLITDISILSDYAIRENTKHEHKNLIKKYYGYRELNGCPWSFRLSRLLYSRAWISNERPSAMFDFATAWLIQNKILLPGASTLSRLISAIKEKAINRLWKLLSSLPTNAQKEKLATLLQIPDGMRVSLFDHYRKGPVTISSVSFNNSIARYLELREFGISNLNFHKISPVRLKSLARHAGTISMHKIARLSPEKQVSILVAFVKAYEVIALDDALDILDILITKISGDAKRSGQKKRLRTLKDLDKSALTLAEICQLILNDDFDDANLRKTIFQKTTKQKLTASIATIHSLARTPGDNYHDEMVEQYGKVRRFLPHILHDIIFKAAPAGENTVAALRYLALNSASRKPFLVHAPQTIISKPWKRLIFDKNARVNKKGYTLCFISKLQDSLRRRDVYVENSDRWGDPRKKLLRGADWQAKRINVCRTLGHPVNANEAIATLTQQLDFAYKQVAGNFATNNSIKIDHTTKHPSLTITNLDKLDEPESLSKLSDQVSNLLPKVDLTELILEINAHTGFSDEFTHVSESNARAEDLPISICAVLLSEACNIGLEPLVKHHIPALTRHRLSWVKQNYFRAETIIRANARLVDYQSNLALAQKWGGGEVASADGMRFVTPVKSINSGPNRKYFGSNKGITWYNFVSDQS